MKNMDKPDSHQLTGDQIAELSQVAREISSGRLADARAFQRILDFTLKLTGADAGSIYLYDKEIDVLRLAGTTGIGVDRLKPVRGSQGITGWVLTHSKIRIVNEGCTDPDYLECTPSMKSEVCVPVLFQDKAVGVLNLESRRKSHFSEDQARLIGLIASILTGAIQQLEIQRLQREIELFTGKKGENTAFILMPFREPFNKYYSSIIKPAVADAGLLPLRADEIFGATEIVKDIWSAINQAKIVITEMTTRNPNVMYEMGLSHAVGKPIIMISQLIEDIPFDLRSLRCILYDTTDSDWSGKLRANLVSSLGVALGEAQVSPFTVSDNRVPKAIDNDEE